MNSAQQPVAYSGTPQQAVVSHMDKKGGHIGWSGIWEMMGRGGNILSAIYFILIWVTLFFLVINQFQYMGNSIHVLLIQWDLYKHFVKKISSSK